MFYKNFLNVLIGFCGGVGVAAGTFAFLLLMRVIPRMISKFKFEKNIIFVENMVVLGITMGSILSFQVWKCEIPTVFLGKIFMILFGFCAGIFVGCIAVALAEILDTFPILLKRMNLKDEIAPKLLFCMAIGKSIGALLYFWMRL